MVTSVLAGKRLPLTDVLPPGGTDWLLNEIAAAAPAVVEVDVAPVATVVLVVDVLVEPPPPTVVLVVLVSLEPPPATVVLVVLVSPEPEPAWMCEPPSRIDGR
jgi:hypothetical protein